MARGQNDYAGGIWVDEAWLDTVVVVGITCFILCLMGLGKVSQPQQCTSRLESSNGFLF
jgi:hypothetical protein